MITNHSSTTQEQFNQIISNNKVCVIFSADWCGPCQMLKSLLDDVDTQMKNVEFHIFDVDSSPQLASSLAVQGIPAIFLYSNSELKNRKAGGFASVNSMCDWLIENGYGTDYQG